MYYPIFTVFLTLFGCACTQNFTVWDDPRQPPATLGFIAHHVGIRVSDFDRSAAFYTNALGFRHIWTNEYDWFKLGYFAYPMGGLNGTGFQTGEEMFSEQTNRNGIMELIWYKNNTELSGRTGGFSHLGFIVPDTYAAESHLNQFNLTWIKRPGQNLTVDGMHVFGVNDDPAPPAWLLTYFRPAYAMVLDPDNYVIELLPAGASY